MIEVGGGIFMAINVQSFSQESAMKITAKDYGFQLIMRKIRTRFTLNKEKDSKFNEYSE